jgi:triosephosphate isomerase (TIM)
MTKVIFGANLKMMNPIPEGSNHESEIELLLKGYKQQGVSSNNVREVIIFPPHDLLSYTKEQIWNLGLNITLGSQGVSEYDNGAHTGEAPSPVSLNELGVNYVLIGHSEVRGRIERLIREGSGIGNLANPPITEYEFNRQMKNAFQHDLNVVYCVGETKEERDIRITSSVLERQIKLGLAEINKDDVAKRLVIAYEPRWAIGTGLTPTLEDIKNAHETIREAIFRAGYSNTDAIPVLYGGSMNPINAAEIMATPGVNGGLVGGACLDAKKFTQVVNYKK